MDLEHAASARAADETRTVVAYAAALVVVGVATAALGALKQQTTMILKPTGFSPIR